MCRWRRRTVDSGDKFPVKETTTGRGHGRTMRERGFGTLVAGRGREREEVWKMAAPSVVKINRQVESKPLSSPRPFSWPIWHIWFQVAYEGRFGLNRGNRLDHLFEH
ncbi:hypothetical protein QYF36_026110 [Acer negundo]|nr:hypothetical protein QYF36_026110 [Acer negundo]